jgi:hypothetical protein
VSSLGSRSSDLSNSAQSTVLSDSEAMLLLRDDTGLELEESFDKDETASVKALGPVE